jgi:hypothetical protein
MADETCTEVYRLHVWICRISPMIWRRLLVRSDSAIADLHYTLQTAFGWSDEHLHRFHIHGQDYGVYRADGHPRKTVAAPWTSSRAGTKYRWTLRNYLRKSKPIWRRAICRPFVIGLNIGRNCTNG